MFLKIEMCAVVSGYLVDIFGCPFYLMKVFAIRFHSYAKVNFNIENLEEYIIKSELFKKCYENYINYTDGKITVGEYLNHVEKIKIDMGSYQKIVKTYAENILNIAKKEK